MTLEVEVIALSTDDLVRLEEYLPDLDEAKYRKRLAEQEAGRIVYLVAWLEGKPVGHCLLRWNPDEPLRSQIPNTPAIADLLVKEGMQSRGIGTHLIHETEEIARRAGRKRVAIGVDVNNRRARSLYERRGYLDSGMPPQYSSWSFIDRQGIFRTLEGSILYLVKDLS